MARTKEDQAAITPEEALRTLKEGQERFRSGDRREADWLTEAKLTSTGQFPIAAILSCLDSRIPVEIVFDQSIGDVFVARIAGNFVNDDILGSLEFATKVAGAKLIVVMGHSACGAVMGACDNAQLGLLTKTLANITPAVEAVQGYEPRNSSNPEFLQAVAEENVRRALREIRSRSQVLRELLDRGQIGLAGAMYDVSTGAVTFME
ncbi:MAG: carbonic anhydrase family protein [Planctomycetota bacterium]|jgi:carbonic anhydrase